jgi:hypothetical protein
MVSVMVAVMMMVVMVHGRGERRIRGEQQQGGNDG